MTIQRKPDWIRSLIPAGDEYKLVSKNLKERGLFTVCEEAKCPNLGECWKLKTATIMILGGTCTRNCRFCNVATGNPKGLLNLNEIPNSSEIVAMLGLKYIVVTSVDRDDLKDYGAGHFANVVRKIREDHPKTMVEVLVPDFNCVHEHMSTLGDADPFVIAHNLETVRRLTPSIRDHKASYQQSLDVLQFYKDNYPNIAIKSSIMVGIGETFDELCDAMDDLRAAGVNILTFGQYLMPTKKHIPVERFYSPEEFDQLKEVALQKGFDFVASGPMVRSSYKASEYLEFLKARGTNE